MRIRDELDPLLDRLGASLAKTNALLTVAINGVNEDPAMIRSWYLRRQAQVVNDIGADVDFLIRNRRLFTVPPLARVAFEASAKMEAAAKIRDYVAQQYLREQAEIVRELESLVKGGAASYQSDLEFQREILMKLRSDLGGVRERGWKFSETVEAAGLKEESDAQYPMLSQAIHSTVRGITAFKSEVLAVWCVPHVMRSMIRAMHHLVFFKDEGATQSQPASANWHLVVDKMAGLVREWDSHRSSINDLLKEAA